MLKITITETQTESRWILQGHLVGPWVRELRRCWKEKHRAQSSQRCVVDLNDVTLIDKGGERLLRAMSKKGAELTASGMYTKHLLEKVKATGKDSSSKLLICFFAAVVVTAIISGDCAQVGRMLAKANAKQCLVPRLNANSLSSLSKSDFTNGDGGIPCPQNS